jgi:hypothetical protein
MGLVAYKVEVGMYQFYNFGWVSDPSHGWLQVGWDLIDDLAHTDISSFSYHDDQYLYLEEDRDAPLFLKLLDSKGIRYFFTESSSNEDSFVRNLTRY